MSLVLFLQGEKGEQGFQGLPGKVGPKVKALLYVHIFYILCFAFVADQWLTVYEFK